ncbi:DUF2164 domain-containing protein [Cohnella sp. REN36]|uniref:DUF2164 domain-containing protein n=1 Tax=Cohnella sp. REN36 TaxID=2887347 RepID=UPI001D150032|nr:DUF2164 domain-containing protein [Cohnella sp. REN36]MCC3374835.1 DUF2164 domain-containing protein [Cohnella sp. REN36]
MSTPLKLPKERKEQIVDQVQAFFETERGEEIGRLAAEQLIDLMIGALGPAIYNQAIGDARQTLQLKMAALEDELYALERPLADPRRARDGR